MAKSVSSRKNSNRLSLAFWAVGIVIAIIVFIVLAKVVSNGSSSSSSGSASNSPAPASLLSKLTSISEDTFTQVGIGTAKPLPKPISGPTITQNGKPVVLYIGAEYCPYCATERWPLIIALSRFGTFSNLSLTHSSSSDVYPNTQTFSFHGSTYTSKYVAYTPVETQSNQLVGGTYATLDTPTSSEQSLLNTYDAPPYVTSQGGIPFIYFGGKYIISGATYGPQVLQGLSYDQIADALAQPGSAIAQGAIGSANAMTAAICEMTSNQPGSVCSTPTISAIQKQLASQ